MPRVSTLPTATAPGTFYTIEGGISKKINLGTIATQNANAVAVTGGSINGVTIGAVTPGAGTFTTVVGSSNAARQATFAGYSTLGGANIFNGEILIGNAPYGMRLAADPSSNSAVTITNMMDTAGSVVQIKVRGGGTPITAASFTDTGCALWVPTVNALRSILVGAADSAGAGFRTLRVVN